MKPITYLSMNGIRTPSEDYTWVDGSEDWGASQNPPIRFVKEEYDERGTVARWVWEDDRADRLAAEMDRKAPTVFVGHSYGCKLGLLAANIANVPPRELHLVSGAFPTDSTASGLNEYLIRNPTAKAFIYRGGADWVLSKVAPKTRFARWLARGAEAVVRGATLGWANPSFARKVGYDSGGAVQPVAAYGIEPSVARRVWFRDRPEFGHSDFLNSENLPGLLSLITGVGERLGVIQINAGGA